MAPNGITRLHPPGPVNFNGPTGLTWRHAYQMIFHPLEFFQKAAHEYGDLTFFRLFGHRGYFINEPELISQVLIRQADAFEKLPRQVNVIRQMFGQGILVTEGQRWKMDRQFLQKAFDSNLMHRNAAASIAVTQKMLKRWSRPSHLGKPVELSREMTRLTAEITSVVLIDEDDPEIMESLTRAMVFISDEFSHEMNSLIRFPDWMPFSRKKQKSKWIQFYNRLVDQLVKKRIQRNIQKDDFLGFLLRAPKPAGTNSSFVRDQLLTMLIAGYHATSMALVWILHALELNPDIEREVLAELDQSRPFTDNGRDTFRELPYLKCTVEEVLRLYPPAWALFARKSTRPVEMQGYRIDTGGWFYMAPFITQRNEQFFPDPLVFDPLRFSDERRKLIPKGAYFPFGLGGHACIGARMAMEQLVLATATILREFRVRRQTPDHNPELEAKLVLRPRKKIWCQLIPVRTSVVTEPIVEKVS